MPSLARNSVAKFLADSGTLVLGLACGIITARWLGPSGKGLLAAITYLAGLLMQAAFLGLGDVAIVRIGHRKSSLQESLSASLTPVVPLALLGGAVLFAAGFWQFHHDWQTARLPVLAACLGIPLGMLSQLNGNLLNAKERFVATSSIVVIASLVTLISTWLLVIVFQLSVLGAVLASMAGTIWTLLATGSLLLRSGLSFRPRVVPDYLRFAFHYGPRVQVSNLLVTLAARFDLLLVYSLAGQAAAGQYSIALTIGALGGMLPFAMTHTSFPRLAYLDETGALELAMRLNRVVVLVSLVGGLVVAGLAPAAIPLAFGRAYRPAVIPALVLLLTGVFGSSQYMLARARAARGHPDLLFYSYAVNTTVMVGLDFALIPRFGITGAAVACALASAVGMTLCVIQYRRAGGGRLPLRAFRPAREDLSFLWDAFVRAILPPAATSPPEG